MCVKVALITGITGAVGKGILLRLINTFSKLKIYGTARSLKRASIELQSIAEDFFLYDKIDSGDLTLLPIELDTSVISTVQELSCLLKKDNDKLDFLYLNAGAIISNGIDFFGAGVQFLTDIYNFPIKPSYILHDGKDTTSDGISKSFAINVYGHYVLTELLQDLLSSSGEGRVFWIGSSEGEESFFNVEDIEGRNSINPYGSNKYCIRVISKLLNDYYKKNDLPIFSVVVTPGILPSNIAASMVPAFLIALVMVPLFWTLRFFLGIKEITLNSHNAAESVIKSTTIPSSKLDLLGRYDSLCTRLGTPYVSISPPGSISATMVENTSKHLLKLNKKFNVKSTALL